jgi:hypothetical protein
VLWIKEDDKGIVKCDPQRRSISCLTTVNIKLHILLSISAYHKKYNLGVLLITIYYSPWGTVEYNFINNSQIPLPTFPTLYQLHPITKKPRNMDRIYTDRDSGILTEEELAIFELYMDGKVFTPELDQ